MKKRTLDIVNSSIANVVIMIVGVGMLYPILWLITASFKETSDIFTSPNLFPANPTFENYMKGWQGIGIVGFASFFGNSFVICILCVTGNVLFCSLTAYAFARLKFKGRNFWFTIMIVTLLLPSQATTIPRYVIFHSIHWIDTILPLVVPKLFAVDAFFVFLMVQFIRSLPKELDESAWMDGAGKWTIYARIVMPLTVPALITTVLFTFLWTWDDFFDQLLYLNSPEHYTVPMGLRLFLDSSGVSSWGSMFAMSVLSLVPCLVLFFALQKYFVQGISTTGIKG